MKVITPPKKPKHRPRRSTRRLGAAATLENSVARPPLAFAPAANFWRVNRSRITGGMVLLLCLWIIYLLFSSDSFYVYGAAVNGNHILNSREIYAASRIDDLSVFWINPGAVKANLEDLPNIKTARVNVTLPARVTIEVEERHPEVIWQTGGATWWIDNEGTFVPPRQEPDSNQNRLRIIDVDNRPVQANDRLDPAIIRAAQIVYGQKPELAELYYAQAVGLVYLTPEGWPVYLGNTAEMHAKLAVAESVRADLLARKVTPVFIDARNPRRVVYQQP